MAYNSLREWLAAIENRGELFRMTGASHELEMAGISDIVARQSRQPPPALLFDEIPGYPKGYRTLFQMLNSPLRLAMALGLPEDELDRVSLARNWQNKTRNLRLIPPKMVKSGPLQENVLTGEDVDLLRFPTPRLHELDGGRYFGTAHGVITRDPDTGWVNFGGYRNMLVDRNRLALHMLPGKDAGVMLRKYIAKKQPMPVAIALGVDPALWFMSITQIPYGVSEYDYAGGIRDEPLEMIEGSYTGLPIPASAEIAVEGEIHADDLVDEGPFGEWNGYYCNQGLESALEPVIRVKTIMHRNNPIFTCVSGGNPPHDYSLVHCLSHSVVVWNALERSAVPGIAGVWCQEAGAQLLTVVSLETHYPGHSRQAALIASQSHRSRVGGRYTIVVDEDVDPSNLNDVMWAVSTRADPERAIEILHYCGSTTADPVIPIELKRKLGNKGPYFMSRAIIDACRPYEWKDEFYPIARVSPALRSKLLEKWSGVFQKIGLAGLSERGGDLRKI